jgi:hypothetical protein
MISFSGAVKAVVTRHPRDRRAGGTRQPAMMEDSRARRARHSFLAAARLYLQQWRRSRAPLGVLAFVIVICLFDALSGARAATPWFTPFVFLAAWTAMLAGYDSYARLRREGALRVVLRRAISRPMLALAMMTSGALVSLAATLLALLYLLVAGRAPLSGAVALAVPVTFLAILGFVAFAQALSLLFPRDVVAIVAMLVIAFGASPYERWLPAGTPALAAGAVRMLWSSLPTSMRLFDVIGGTGSAMDLAVIAAQLLAAFAVICALLGRPPAPSLREPR